MCETCPFNYTDASFEVQNYGCLRSSKEILDLKDETGHNWACHSNNQRICRGLQEHRDTSTGGLYLQPGENSDFISWAEEDRKPIIK